MQGIEGELDTVHAAFLHGGAGRVTTIEPGTFQYYEAQSRAESFAERYHGSVSPWRP